MLRNCLASEERREWFSYLFFEIIESWFSASVACCDSCYNEFLAIWPHAYSADDARFQKCGYPLDVIYSGSRLSELFDRIEFDTFIKEIDCPRCGNVLGPNIWPYTFPFKVDSAFESKIFQIAALAEKTPFLLLKHPFAKQVFDTLTRLSSSIPKTTFKPPLYRARLGEVPKLIKEFDAPPPEVVKEGRYNHGGSPVVYLASDVETCIEEMHRISCVIAEIELYVPLTILDLTNPATSHPDFADELSALTYSALISAKQPTNGWHKPAYVFSRFISDCVKASGIQGIKYPSIHITKDSNFNLVVVDPSFRLASHAKIRRFQCFKHVEQSNATSN